MPSLISEEAMDMITSGDNFDAKYMSTDMLETIRDVSQSHPIVNMRESCHKI